MLAKSNGELSVQYQSFFMSLFPLMNIFLRAFRPIQYSFLRSFIAFNKNCYGQQKIKCRFEDLKCRLYHSIDIDVILTLI